MKPQTLNTHQTSLVERCRTAHDRYRRLKDESDRASDQLTDILRETDAAGVTRYRLGQELGMRTQSIDGRLAYVKAARRPEKKKR